MARFARQLNFINIFPANYLDLNSIMIRHISFIDSFQILKLSNYAYVLMLFIPLIVTPPRASICKLMNSEVSRIAGFYTYFSKNILGVPFQYNSASLVLLTQCKSFKLQLYHIFILEFAQSKLILIVMQLGK